MKSNLTLLCFLISISTFSQTNVFPSSGSVGIGTLAPANRLEVFGNTFNRISAIVNADVQTGYQAKKTGVNAADWEFYIPSASTDFRFYRAGTGDILTLKINGHIGIGTTVPSSRLHIYDDGSSGGEQLRLQRGTGTVRFVQNFNTDDLYLYNRDASKMYMYWRQDGNVGIGTITPQSKLDVFGGRLTQQGAIANDNNAVFVNSDPTGYGIYSKGGLSTHYAFHFENQAGTSIIYGRGDGNIGIGTIYPDAKLAVKGTVHANEVKVDLSVPGPDYVFANNYQLQPLNELKTYIDQHKHLPEVPSAAAMEANGINLGEMNMLLLKKIEELTLYVIEQNKKMIELKEESADQGKLVKLQQKELENLKNKIK
jgi:hypothetical protein